MNLKTMLASMLVMMCTTPLFAQGTPTTDRVVVSFDEEDSEPIILNQSYGEDDDYPYFTVSLEGSDIIYTGYQMDIHLPAGMSVVVNDEGDLKIELADPAGGMDKNFKGLMYPCTASKITTNVYSYSYSHTIVSEMQEGNIVRVICTSAKNEDMKDTSGGLFHVYVKASQFLKPGDIDITIDNVILTHNEWSEEDQQKHAYSYKPSAPCGGIITGVLGECSNVPLTISSAGWSTCILPFDAEIPDGVEAFTCDAYDESNLLLVKASAFKAFTPYILKATNGSFSGEVSGTVDGDNYPESGVVNKGYINGAIVPQQISSGFVLQNLQSEGVKFYPMNGKVFSIPAGKCWVTLPAEAGVKGFCLTQNENADGIETVNSSVPSSACYTLDGKLVETPRIGQIYVRDGKKLLKVK